jgi:hypothetical protein
VPRCVAGPDPSAVKITAPAPAVRLGLELALKLHQAPALGAVRTDIRLDLGGQLGSTRLEEAQRHLKQGLVDALAMSRPR